MFVRYLDDKQIREIDPNNIAKTSLARYQISEPFFDKPNYMLRENYTPEIAIQQYLKRRKSLETAPHAFALEHDNAMLEKCGAQGGAFPIAQMKDIAKTYYENAHDLISISPIIYKGRDFLITAIRDKLTSTMIADAPYSFVRGTFAGLPFGGKKGGYQAETVGMKPFRHVYPCIPGQRRMRQGDRLIFQDSVCNVRILEEILASSKTVLRTLFPFFDAWKNPSVQGGVNEQLTQAVLKEHWFYEGDYKKMDQHFSAKIAREICVPVLEAMDITTPYLVSFIDELFMQPLFWGDELWTGLHNLFSGQVITNDFETIYSVCLYAGILIDLKVNPYDAVILALGDDVVVSHPSELIIRKVASMAKELSDRAGMIVHSVESGKSAIRRGKCQFLRKTYYPAAPKDYNGVILGAYPPCLAINNVVSPERVNHNSYANIAACLQRCDGAIGSPFYEATWPVLTKLKVDWHRYENATEAAKLQVDRDWWDKLYGEKWDASTSPSFIKVMRSVLRTK